MRAPYNLYRYSIFCKQFRLSVRRYVSELNCPDTIAHDIGIEGDVPKQRASIGKGYQAWLDRSAFQRFVGFIYGST